METRNDLYNIFSDFIKKYIYFKIIGQIQNYPPQGTNSRVFSDPIIHGYIPEIDILDDLIEQYIHTIPSSSDYDEPNVPYIIDMSNIVNKISSDYLYSVADNIIYYLNGMQQNIPEFRVIKSLTSNDDIYYHKIHTDNSGAYFYYIEDKTRQAIIESGFLISFNHPNKHINIELINQECTTAEQILVELSNFADNYPNHTEYSYIFKKHLYNTGAGIGLIKQIRFNMIKKYIERYFTASDIFNKRLIPTNANLYSATSVIIKMVNGYKVFYGEGRTVLEKTTLNINISVLIIWLLKHRGRCFTSSKLTECLDIPDNKLLNILLFEYNDDRDNMVRTIMNTNFIEFLNYLTDMQYDGSNLRDILLVADRLFSYFEIYEENVLSDNIEQIIALILGNPTVSLASILTSIIPDPSGNLFNNIVKIIIKSYIDHYKSAILAFINALVNGYNDPRLNKYDIVEPEHELYNIGQIINELFGYKCDNPAFFEQLIGSITVGNGTDEQHSEIINAIRELLSNPITYDDGVVIPVKESSCRFLQALTGENNITNISIRLNQQTGRKPILIHTCFNSVDVSREINTIEFINALKHYILNPNEQLHN